MKCRKIIKSVVVLVAFIILLLDINAALDLKASESPEEVCQCFSSAYKITLINDDVERSSLHISTDDPEITIAPTELTIDGKDSKSILVFLTPACDKKPGVYDFKLQISDDKNKTYTFKQEYQLKECRSLELKTKDIEVCVNEPVSEFLEIINRGRVKEDVLFEVSKGKIVEKEIVLNPEEKKNVEFEADKFTNPGDYSVRINYKTKDNYISEQDSFKIKVDPCSSFEVNLTPSQEVCLGETAKLLLIVKNTGKIDEEFTLSSQDLNINQSKVKVDASNSKIISFNVTPTDPGEKDIIINIDSKYGGSKKLYSKVKATNCCGISLISSPTPIEICAGTKAEISVLMSVLNSGLKSQFQIESDSPWLTPEINNIILNKSEVQQFVAKVKPLDKEGTYRSIIRAKNDFCEDKAFITLKVKNCYGLNASIEKEDSEACSDEGFIIPLKIKNTGEADSTYNIKVLNPKELSSETDSIHLSQDQEGDINLFLNTTNLTGNVNLEIVISDDKHPEIKQIIKKSINVEKCYDFDMSLEDLEACSTQDIELTEILTNQGTKEDEYEFEYLCPSWIEFKTDKVFLEPQESAKIKLYGKVPVEANGKKSLCSIIVRSKNTNKSKIFKSNLNIKDNNECFCTQAVLNMDKINIGLGKSKIVNVDIENCGVLNQTYKCEVSDELKDFAYITPEEFKLEPNEKDRCYIGFIPKTPSEDEINGNIIISNGIFNIKKPISIKIVG